MRRGVEKYYFLGAFFIRLLSSGLYQLNQGLDFVIVERTAFVDMEAGHKGIIYAFPDRLEQFIGRFLAHCGK